MGVYFLWVALDTNIAYRHKGCANRATLLPTIGRGPWALPILYFSTCHLYEAWQNGDLKRLRYKYNTG